MEPKFQLAKMEEGDTITVHIEDIQIKIECLSIYYEIAKLKISANRPSKMKLLFQTVHNLLMGEK